MPSIHMVSDFDIVFVIFSIVCLGMGWRIVRVTYGILMYTCLALYQLPRDRNRDEAGEVLCFCKIKVYRLQKLDCKLFRF